MTASEPIISVSGLRGLIGKQLTPEVALRYASAFAATLDPGHIVIGRDGRSSGKMLADVIRATLVGRGFSVVDLGVAATPTVGIEVRRHQAEGGIQISASHNPIAYNGLKLFGKQGRVIPKQAGESVLANYRDPSANDASWVEIGELGTSIEPADPHAAHCQAVLGTVDVESIRGKSFKVLLDSNRGAGSLLGRKLLEELGCQVTVLGPEPDGQFEHPPEPVAGNLSQVAELVRTGGFDIGFCQDPDADRLAIIDEQGTYIGEELTLALCLLHVLPNVSTADQKKVIVTNCATSSVSRTLAKQHGFELLQSAVGEANVCDLMIDKQAVFGGEGNGGPIDPQVGFVRDSFVGMARVLNLLADTHSSVSELVSGLPPLSIVKDKVDMDVSELPVLFETLKSAFSEAAASEPDGLKLDWGESWLLVRGSNTEPIVRFIAEAATTEAAQEICDQAKALVQ